MRARTALATSTAAAAALLMAAPAASADIGPVGGVTTCKQSQLTVKAAASDRPYELHVSIKNTGLRPCIVDSIPTVSFGDLDGPALPVPTTESEPYSVGATRSAYATVRTIDPDALGDARVVDYVTVAGDPSHDGTRFTADTLGSPGGVKVWEPLTTWWHTTQAAADAALDDAVG